MNRIHLQFDPDLEYQRKAVEAVCGLFEGAERGSCTFSVVMPRKMERAGDNLGLVSNADQHILESRLNTWQTKCDLGNVPGASVWGENGNTHSVEMPDGDGRVSDRLGLAMEAERNILDSVLSTQQIKRNLRKIQEANGIEREEKCETLDFTVEMETGTGKTYVYLRSIYELNRRYGFKKFVIVVPSLAIKAGVEKSLEMMGEHFRKLYDGVETEYFAYDSGQLGRVWNFCISDKLQIMICTIQAITEIGDGTEKKGRGAQRVLHRAHEAMGGSKPIEYIQHCRPIVIVDEPQKIGEKGEAKGIAALHPLCTIRYSATHKDMLHPIYRLTAVDAAQQKLVKRIEVASVQTDGEVGTGAAIRVLGTSGEMGGLAHLRMRVRKRQGGYGTKVQKVLRGATLSDYADGWAVYDDIVLQEVHEDGSVQLSRRGEEINLARGQEWTGDAQEDRMWARVMVRTTIEEHLRKELELRPRGIKVLSLFFINRVADYRDGKEKGWLARVFEEEYAKVTEKPEYRSLYEAVVPLSHEVHGGYFAVDRKRKNDTSSEEERWIDTEGRRKEEREAEARAYELIMRDKEKLLSLDEPLKFIFSHSALREGWDNPNVFQVCILRDMDSAMSRRQALGRGLRICVDQSGQRVREEGVNTLTVISREEFSEYAKNLQREYEEDGLVFGVLDVGKLGARRYMNAQGEEVTVGQDAARSVIADLRKRNLLRDGRPTVELRELLDRGEYTLPEDVDIEAAEPVMEYLKAQTQSVEVHNARERAVARSQYEKFRENQDFIELWNRIKKKTTYRVQFSTEELVEEVVRHLDGDSGLRNVRLPEVTVDVNEVKIKESGVQADEPAKSRRNLEMQFLETSVPDIVTALEERTHLTRSTLCRILSKTENLAKLRVNAAEFERITAKVINDTLKRLMVDGIRYEPVTIGDKEYSAQELFKDEEGYRDKMVGVLRKCLTDHVIFDSKLEEQFARDAERQEEVKLYTKLPASFTINTPLGKYNPDWAIVVEKHGQQHLYFVVETKGADAQELELLRTPERGKIACARRHFDKIGVQYEAPVKDLREFIAKI